MQERKLKRYESKFAAEFLKEFQIMKLQNKIPLSWGVLFRPCGDELGVVIEEFGIQYRVLISKLEIDHILDISVLVHHVFLTVKELKLEEQRKVNYGNEKLNSRYFRG